MWTRYTDLQYHWFTIWLSFTGNSYDQSDIRYETNHFMTFLWWYILGQCNAYDIIWSYLALKTSPWVPGSSTQKVGLRPWMQAAIWLVLLTILKNMKVTYIYTFMENKTCSKPPTSYSFGMFWVVNRFWAIPIMKKLNLPLISSKHTPVKRFQLVNLGYSAFFHWFIYNSKYCIHPKLERKLCKNSTLSWYFKYTSQLSHE